MFKKSKIVVALIAGTLLSTSAYAICLDGVVVKSVIMDQTGKVWATTSTSGTTGETAPVKLMGTPGNDAYKAFTAAWLTVKSSGSTITGCIGGQGWYYLKNK